MKAAGYDVRESDPFQSQSSMSFTRRESSPYVSRIRLMWQEMRGPVLDLFPAPPDIPLEDVYTSDAYHSLSIEGYQVSHELEAASVDQDISAFTKLVRQQHRQRHLA